MRVTNVIVRFLSLLDVAFVLVGALMVMLMQAQFQARQPRKVIGLPQIGGVDVVYVYAGWRGEQNGKCFLLNENGTIDKKIRTDTPDDISAKAKKKAVVMLLFDRNGWYSEWPDSKVAELRKTWKDIEVVPVYDVPWPQQRTEGQP